MHQLNIPVVRAFVDADQGGNPAGVVLNADQYDQVTRQRIATNVGLSETAFVSASPVADLNWNFLRPFGRSPSVVTRPSPPFLTWLNKGC